MAETRITVTGRFVGGGLFEPRKQENDRSEKYSACVVLDPGQSKKVEQAIQAAKSEKWGSKAPPGLQIWGTREGDDPDYEASFEKEFINPKSTRKPRTIYKQDGVAMECNQDDDLLYPGAFVAVSIDAYAYPANKEKGISKPGITLNLRAVMFRKHGERLGDVFDAEEEFGNFESEIQDDDMDFLEAS